MSAAHTVLLDAGSSSDEDERVTAAWNTTAMHTKTDNAAGVAPTGVVPEFDIYSGEPLNRAARELRAAQAAISPSRTLLHTVSSQNTHLH